MEHAAGAPAQRGIHDARQVEVAQARVPVLVHEQVGGLEVAVQHGRRAAVQVQHALGRLQRQRQPPAPAQVRRGRLRAARAVGAPRRLSTCQTRLFLQASIQPQLAGARTRFIRARLMGPGFERRVQVSSAGRRPAAGRCSRALTRVHSLSEHAARRHALGLRCRLCTQRRTGEARARASTSRSDPRAQKAVTMHGGSGQAPRKSTTLGCRSAAIRPASRVRPSSSAGSAPPLPPHRRHGQRWRAGRDPTLCGYLVHVAPATTPAGRSAPCRPPRVRSQPVCLFKKAAASA